MSVQTQTVRLAFWSVHRTRAWVPAIALIILAVVGTPFFWLLGTALSGIVAGDTGLTRATLPRAVSDTASLMVLTGLFAGIAGLASAWLVTHFEFPLRRTLQWALVLPLAVPTYLAAYSFVEFADFTGPLQSTLRSLTGAETIGDYWFPEVRSFGGAVTVFSLVLYPYVYLTCRALFLMESGSMAAAARTMGASQMRTFWRVTLPLSRPALVVGMTLAMMEVVNDLGAVQYFGINSLTAEIYSTWINRSDFSGASQLAITIVLVIGLLIVAEQRARRHRLFIAGRDSRQPPVRDRLTGWQGSIATLFCLGLILFGFGIPAGEMLSLAVRSPVIDALGKTWEPALTTITLAASGSVLTVALSLATASLMRTSKVATPPLRLATLGYAVPGTVLALGLLQPLGLIDHGLNATTRAWFGWTPGLVLSGSAAALLYLYAVRFLALGHSTLLAAMAKRGDSILDAGRVLGVRGPRLFFTINLPTLSPALLSAAILVFVEIAKELPGTLLLRPLGVETLATIVYGFANAGFLAQAAVPSLAIIMVGLLPVVLATRVSDPRPLN